MSHPDTQSGYVKGEKESLACDLRRDGEEPDVPNRLYLNHIHQKEFQ
jgi:hypothetical protein